MYGIERITHKKKPKWYLNKIGLHYVPRGPDPPTSIYRVYNENFSM